MTEITTTTARAGDLIHVVGCYVGDAPRSGEIIDVLGDRTRLHFRNRWEDDHEGLLYPGSDIVVVRPTTNDTRRE